MTDLEHPGTRTTNHLASKMQQPPAHSLHLMRLPRRIKCALPEQHKQIVGNGTDTKEHGIGTELTTRHALHAKADFQFLDPIFRGLPTLAVPHVNVVGAFARIKVARHKRVFGDSLGISRLALVIEEFRLRLATHNDKTKGALGSHPWRAQFQQLRSQQISSTQTRLCFAPQF